MRGARILAIVLVLLASCACTRAPRETPRPPNIVFILADDLGYGELGVYGQELIETPNIDALAAGGLRFMQHYAGSAVCAPSRSALLTGKHTGHTPIRGNDELPERGDVWNFQEVEQDPGLEGQRPLPQGTQTLGRMLQSAGYETAIVGKWGLGGPLTEGIPNEQGFDFFFGYNCQRQAHTYYPVHLWRNREKVLLANPLVAPHVELGDDADPEDAASYAPFTLADYAPDRLLEEALGLIEQNRDRPFFLLFASPLPHLPLQAPKRLVDRYVAKLGPEEPYLGEDGYFPSRAPRATYAAMVSTLDEQVGAIVEKLETLGLEDDTLIIFTSDNGPTYTGGADTQFFDSARPFSAEYGRGKGFLYEGGIRVPLIARWPGHVKEGSTTHHLSAFWDVLPTLVEIAGGDVPDTIDGVSFAPLLKGEPNQEAHDFLYWELAEYGGQQAVRLDHWKGLRRNIQEGNLTIELYDLEVDPLERDDVAAANPDVVRQIETILAREHVRSPYPAFQLPAVDR